jgi:predicted  nucleic acid-binding Zn-ribbon protein
MSEHEERADALEREVDDMEERAERLEDDIGAARKDWERKKQDPSVPGAPTDGEDDED